LNLLLAILGIGFLIFVHELGHFLAAKFVGVRVHTFAVGFQPTIFGWKARLCAFTYGETEYVIGLVPLGGYVQMAGEEPGDDRSEAENEFHNKPIPGRLLILVAGAAMNLIFGLLLFIAAYTAGVKQVAPVVGTAVAGGPAWSAGVRSGDLITAVNGEEWSDYSNVATAIALSGGSQAVTLTLLRDDRSLDIPIEPMWDPVAGRYRIGISPAISDRIASVQEGSPAQRVGLQEGDRLRGIRISIPSEEIIAVGARDITADRMLQTLWDLRNSTASGKLILDIQRDEQSLVMTLDLTPSSTASETSGARGIGVLPRSRSVVAIQKDSAAASVFKMGQEIVSIENTGSGKKYPVEILDLLTIGQAAGDADVELLLGLRSSQEQIRVGSEQLRSWIGEDLIIGSVKRTVVQISDEAADQLSIPIGAEIVSIAGVPLGAEDYIDVEIAAGSRIEWIDSSISPERLKSVEVAGSNPIQLGLVLGSPARIGRTLAGSPAAESDLPEGSVVTSINGIQVEKWDDLVGAVRSDDESYNIVLSSADSGTIEAQIAPRALMDPIGIAMSVHQFNEQHSVSEAMIQGYRQSWIWGGRIFLTLKALFSGDVHGKNLNGPVGIIDMGRKVSQVGLGNLLFLLALISINLGVFNLLPFPILDGGHIFFLLIEAVRGQPVPEKIQQSVHMVAFLMLISLALFVTYNDLLRLW